MIGINTVSGAVSVSHMFVVNTVVLGSPKLW